ncbi:MAG: PQQ-binding-like beta-propeller repeat protein [Cyclobacteriaceae bacterium]
MEKFCICIFLIYAMLTSCQPVDSTHKHWKSYKGSKDANSYSSLTQINRENVKDLKVAWTFSTGDKGGNIECNPIIVGRRMYLLSPKLKLFAVDAATGEKLWMFDPFAGTIGRGVSRGLAYWEEDDEKKIFFSAGKNLYAINADTGQPDLQFGDQGKVNLNMGLDRDPGSISVTSTSPGIVFQNLLIMGSTTGESYDAAPGHVRAYDVHSGEIVWTFHTIPQPGEFGYETWPEDAYQKVGGANVWGGMSLDEERGIVYLPTGSPAYDFYGGFRKGKNLFGNSIIALNAATGERIWHFQTVHHDLWDYDLPCPPNLLRLQKEGKEIDALAQVSKNGFVYVLDRLTGEPVFPIEERPVPGSSLAGEEAWPTQPIPVKPPPFARQHFTRDDLDYLKDDEKTLVSSRLDLKGRESIYTPPSTEGNLMIPGANGGANWGGAAADPHRGLLFINSHNWPTLPKMKAISTAEAENGEPELPFRLYQKNCAPCHGINREGQHPTIPNLIKLDERLNKEATLRLLENGSGLMPSFAHLSLKDRERIVSYLYDLADKPDSVPASEIVTKEKAEDLRYISSNGYAFLNNEQGYPSISPPWGTLTAYDLNKGEMKWQVPLGEYDDLSRRGMPPTGTLNWGGAAVTATGLVFIGATQDQKFRAFDSDSGEVLWETQLPTGGFATPAVYQVEGRQYVAIACGGTRDTPAGDSYVVFSLPEEN